jgi:hypothetical protein
MDIETVNQISKIFVFFPNLISKERPLQDLSEKFKNSSLATGVFNEPLVSIDKMDHVQLQSAEKAANFVAVHKLIKGEFDLEMEDDGVVLELNETFVKRARSRAPSYVRFRVSLSERNPYYRDKLPFDAKVLSGFDQFGIIDFRVNDARNLPDYISRRMVDTGNTVFEFERIDFLVAIGVQAEVLDGHQRFHKCRLLEQEIWGGYSDSQNSGGIEGEMVVYHWREVSGENRPQIKDFVAFVKFRFRRSNWVTLLMFSGITLMLGTLGSFVPKVVQWGWLSGVMPLFSYITMYVQNYLQ